MGAEGGAWRVEGGGYRDLVEDEGGDGPVYATERLPSNPAQISSAVCFGMPSMAPQTWREDVRRASAALPAGKILIVSVVATPAEGATARQVADDFAQCAAWAAEGIRVNGIAPGLVETKSEPLGT